MYLNCILNLFLKTFLNDLNKKKESITLSCLGLVVCFSSDSPDTGMSFGARQKWPLKVIYEVELQTP